MILVVQLPDSVGVRVVCCSWCVFVCNALGHVRLSLDMPRSGFFNALFATAAPGDDWHSCRV